MKRLLLLSSYLMLPFATPAYSQAVTASSINASEASASFSIDTSGDALFNSLHSFDTVNIDPNSGQYNLLPVASLHCHQVAQSYVLAQSCLGSQATTAAETYGYSFNMANTDSGTGAPASSAAGGSGTDKVVVYIGGDEQSSHSNLWGLNEVVWARNGMGGVTGAEWDLNRAATCNSKTDLGWIGDTTCPQFIGQWITGLNGGGTGGPAIFITQADGSNTALWNDGVAIASGLSVRDTGFLDASNSTTVLKADGTHAYGIDVYNSNITTAALHLMSGNFWGPANGQGIFWSTGPSSNGSTGGTDSITDYGSGLTLTTDASHLVRLVGGNLSLAAGAVYVTQNPAVSGVPTPYIQQDSVGNLRVAQSGTTTGGLDVDGTATAANVMVRGGVYFPTVNGNQPVLTTDTSGSLHITGTNGKAALDLDEATNLPSLNASGSVTAGSVSSGGSLTYGTSNAAGNHQVTDLAISSYTLNGTVALTPQAGAESSTNNLGVITTGGAKVIADVMCQNGTDMSSWAIKAAYLVINGTLTKVGQSVSADISPTSGATSWGIAPTVDTTNSAPEVVVGFGSGGSVGITCTGHAEIITVR